MIIPNIDGHERIGRRVVCIAMFYDSVFMRGVVQGMIDNFKTQIEDLQVTLIVTHDAFAFERLIRRAFTECPHLDFAVALDKDSTVIVRQVAREFGRDELPIVAVDFSPEFVSMSVEYPYGQVSGEVYKRVVPFNDEGLHMLRERREG